MARDWKELLTPDELSQFADALKKLNDSYEVKDARISKLEKRIDRLREALGNVAEDYDTRGDDTDHDCGIADGGSGRDCYACQLKRTAAHLWAVINDTETK